MAKVILFKKFKFDHMIKWYMQNPVTVLENDTHKIFDIHTDYLISAKIPDHIIINNQKKKKRTCKIVDFAVLADHRIKLKENKKKDKYLDLARELKKSYGTWRRQLVFLYNH